MLSTIFTFFFLDNFIFLYLICVLENYEYKIIKFINYSLGKLYDSFLNLIKD